VYTTYQPYQLVQDFAVESGLLDLDRVDAAADTLAAELSRTCRQQLEASRRMTYLH